MKKLILLFLIIIVGAIAAAGYFFSTIVSTGVVAGVENIGPKVTKTTVSLNDFKLSLLNGSATIDGLKVGNPEGYTAEQAFSLGSVDVELVPSSLMSDTIHIKKIHIKSPEFSFEQTLSKNNLKELLKNVEEFTGGSDTSSPSTAEEPSAGEEQAPKKIMIDSLIIEGGKIEAVLLGQSLSADLPTIDLKDIGKESNGITSADAFKIALAEVTKSVGAIVQDTGKKILSGEMDIKDIEKDVKGKAEDVVKGLKNLF